MNRMILTFMLLLGISGCSESIDNCSNINREELLDAHNRERNSKKIVALKHDPILADRAQKWAERMAKTNNLTHSKLELGKFSTMGENIAMGYNDVQSVTRGWMDSPGHRRNILNKRFTHVGFGCARRTNGAMFWCALFAGE